VRLCVGDDWAQDHHDIEVMDEAGTVLARRRLPEGVVGIGQLHELIGRFVPVAAGDSVSAEVQVGIETDHGPWVTALIAAGYVVFAVNPLQASRFRSRHGVSGAKSDGGDAHMLADVVRTDAHQLRPAAGDSPAVQAVKVLTRTHKTLIWERAAVVLRLRAQLLEYFPAAVAAFEDLDARDTLELLGKAPDPTRAAKLTRAQVAAALKRAGRYKITERTEMIVTALRSPQLGQPPALTAAYAATVRSLIAVIATLNQQVSRLQGQVEAHFGQHPDAEIYLSQPGLGEITGARVLSEFGDDPRRYASGKARRNYAGTSPITRASGKKKIVTARFVRNDRLIDALMIQAFAALRGSPGARAFYDQQRAKGLEHNDALRRLAGRLVGILHGCLKTRTCYDEATAWGHREGSVPEPEAAA
jgi:transposase